MAYFSYKISTGELLQISDYDITILDDMAVSSSPLPKLALESEYQWDQTLLDFVPKNLTKLTKLEFLRKFTTQERIAIRSIANTDPVVFDAMELLNLAEFISISDQDTINLVAYLASIGIIQPTRISEILG